MGLAIYCSVWALNAICVMLRKNSKIILWISIIFCGLLFCTDPGISGDAYYYRRYLENPASWTAYMDPGYAALVFLIRSIGVRNYGVFLFVVFLIVLFFFYKGVRKISASVHPMLFVAMAYILPFMMVMVRNVIGMAILLYALIDFCTSRKKGKYALWVAAASLFHLSSVAFFLFLLVPNSSKRRKRFSAKKLVTFLFIVGVALFTVATMLNGKRLPFEKQIITVLSYAFSDVGDKVHGYLSTTTGTSFLAFYFIYFVQLLATWYMTGKTEKMDTQTATLVNTVHSVNILFMVFLPFFLISTIFLRFLFVPSLLTVLCAAKVLYGQETDKRTKNRLRVGIYDVAFVILAASWFVVEAFGIFGVTITSCVGNGIFG